MAASKLHPGPQDWLFSGEGLEKPEYFCSAARHCLYLSPGRQGRLPKQELSIQRPANGHEFAKALKAWVLCIH